MHEGNFLKLGGSIYWYNNGLIRLGVSHVKGQSHHMTKMNKNTVLEPQIGDWCFNTTVFHSESLIWKNCFS